MSKPVQIDNPIESTSKRPRLDLQKQIQRGIVLATQLCRATNKEHLHPKEWIANQAAANELLHTFENMQGKTVNTSEAIEGLIAAQVKLEVKMKMGKLAQRPVTTKLYSEIEGYLGPSQPGSRERIVKLALAKLEGVRSTDLAAKVSEAVESTILGELHKGIDGQMRSYMN